ncbi:MAG: flagellar type III secretion system pore protein FliP [Armatimonadetes bacterium]|nr:flagellar type III secretion system pore protein FliP [Armatimonadota bacterium]MDW8027462.1 flagellar type III secretion system pore protein FliP [Armatimonadota bacterium]
MIETVSFIRVIASCTIVCLLAFWLGVWLRRLKPIQYCNNRSLRLLELLPIGTGKSIALVACHNRKFLIAVTQQSIHLLTEIDEPAPHEISRSGFSHKACESKSHSDEGFSSLRNGETETKTAKIFRRFFPMLPLLVLLLFALSFASPQSPVPSAPTISPQSQVPSPQQQLSLMRESVQILMLLTLIALAPFLLAVMTCFTRIVIVLSLLRVAMGTPQTPPNPVIIGMALFLTIFVMAPTLQEANEKGLQPFLQKRISLEQAISEGYKPFQKFMLRQVREKDIALFLRVAKLPNPRKPEDVPAYILVPAFVLSEVRIGFEIGFLLSIPFLVVDLVIASVLMGMGMLMVPPMLISLPLKLLLFVLADGWHLLMKGLALSVR